MLLLRLTHFQLFQFVLWFDKRCPEKIWICSPLSINPPCNHTASIRNKQKAPVACNRTITCLMNILAILCIKAAVNSKLVFWIKKKNHFLFDSEVEKLDPDILVWTFYIQKKMQGDSVHIINVPLNVYAICSYALFTFGFKMSCWSFTLVFSISDPFVQDAF